MWLIECYYVSVCVNPGTNQYQSVKVGSLGTVNCSTMALMICKYAGWYIIMRVCPGWHGIWLNRLNNLRYWYVIVKGLSRLISEMLMYHYEGLKQMIWYLMLICHYEGLNRLIWYLICWYMIMRGSSDWCDIWDGMLLWGVKRDWFGNLHVMSFWVARKQNTIMFFSVLIEEPVNIQLSVKVGSVNGELFYYGFDDMWVHRLISDLLINHYEG